MAGFVDQQTLSMKMTSDLRLRSDALVHSSFSSTLPIEIWRLVIASAVETLEPMDNYHDASEPLAERFHLARRVTSESPEYALMLVCKTFQYIATKFFYEKISIHSITQLIYFSKCLEEPNIAHNVSKWTRRLDIKYACRERDYDNHKKRSKQLVPILKWCPNLTHLILDVLDFLSEDGAEEGEAIVDACGKSCKRLELLHWDVKLKAHKPFAVPLRAFVTAFRNIKVLRLVGVAWSHPNDPEAVNLPLGGLPFLHTIEAGKVRFFEQFKKVSLPSLSTLHVRNEYFVDWLLVNNLLAFLSPCGGNIKTLTIVGTVVAPYAGNFAGALQKCMNLEELVMDVIDLYRLRPFDSPLHPQVTELTLTNFSPNSFTPTNNFRETLIPVISARFPALEVLRWLGNVDRNVSRSDSRGGSVSMCEAADASHAHTSEIRIENRDGEKLEPDWLWGR
ncbi:hypothetical protein BD410DRAFT_805162 [Rickenella mellea]|uniref:F-box domain-containing protein n=1 Tax=Rickenella mellea TaxID=50990 RepID=A0A4Y7PXJ6_9AGAM|nr:hypothetical protein BD410DRAFT_805162 [Rickenella mellea]